MNTKAKGARFERRVKDKLIKEGWFVVRQAASTFPDLIGVKGNGVLSRVGFFECKSRKTSFSKREKNLLIFYKSNLSIEPYLCYPLRKGRKVVVQIDEIF